MDIFTFLLNLCLNFTGDETLSVYSLDVTLSVEEILDEILENDPAQSEGDEPVSKS